MIPFHQEQDTPPVPFQVLGDLLFHVGTTPGTGGHPSLRGPGSHWGITPGPTPARAARGSPPGPPRSGLPLSDPPFPGLTGSLGLTSPLQLWQKNRCCCTAAASAIFPHCRRCRHSSQSSERGPERPRTSGQLVCSAPSLQSAAERDRAAPRGGRRSGAPWWEPPIGSRAMPGGGSGSDVAGSGGGTAPLSWRR